MNHTVTSHTEAGELLTGRCQQRRKLANNTWLERHDNDIYSIRLHNTTIVEYHPNGDIVLNTGGWQTVTTKDRMNRYTPASIHQTDRVWYLIHNGDTYDYADGITLHADGTVTGHADATYRADRQAEARAVNRRIKRFLDRLTPDVIQGALIDHGTGATALSPHIDGHYFTRSMARTAIADRGYNVEVIESMALQSAIRGRVDNILVDCLRRYLRKLLAPEGIVT